MDVSTGRGASAEQLRTGGAVMRLHLVFIYTNKRSIPNGKLNEVSELTINKVTYARGGLLNCKIKYLR